MESKMLFSPKSAIDDDLEKKIENVLERAALKKPDPFSEEMDIVKRALEQILNDKEGSSSLGMCL